MSRLFDGVDDVMSYALPASGGPNMTYGTTVLVLKEATTTDNTWQSWVEMKNTSNVVRYAVGRRNTTNGDVYYANHVGIESSPGLSITDSDGWVVVAVSKATGTSSVIIRKIPIGGSPSTVTVTTTFADSSGTGSGTLRLGGNEDFANFYLAAVGVWVGTVLTTTQIDGIASAKTTQSIADLSPTWLVDDSDAFATDLIGTVDRTAITGTTDSADDPSGWVYGLGSPDATVTAVPATALADAPLGTVTGSNDATVTAAVSVALADAPVGGAAVTANATVVAVIAQALADAPLGVVSGSAGGTVTAVPATCLAAAPPANQMISSVVNAPAVTVLADAPAAVVSTVGDGTVTAVPSVCLADATLGAVLAGAEVTGVPSDATGAAPLGVLSATANVAAVPALAVAQAPRPTISPAPSGGGGMVTVATTFAEDSA